MTTDETELLTVIVSDGSYGKCRMISKSLCYWVVGGYFLLAIFPADATEITVDAGGNIQYALDAAQPGDVVTVRGGVFNEKITFPRSGDAANGWITLRAYPGEMPILDGRGVAGLDMIYMEDKSCLRIIGFEIRQNTGITNGSGIRLVGACQNVEIISNVIHEIRGLHAMGITVYGTRSTPATNIVIRSNQIYDCDPATSEALVLNGNVMGFEISSNTVHDVNNIGIDMIGGETDITTQGVCRNGICRDNHVYRARSSYEDGYAAGIYVDGGCDIVIERNCVHDCDMGLEIGAENAGITVTGVVVRNNVLFNNDKAGLGFGGYEEARGRVQGCCFYNNLCYKNNTLQQDNGELWIQWSSGNVVENNIFYCGSQNKLLNSQEGNTDNRMDYNAWYGEAGSAACIFDWNGTTFDGFDGYREATHQDGHSSFIAPGFLAPQIGNFNLPIASAFINAGNPAYNSAFGRTDYYGQSRLIGGRIDVGPIEAAVGNRADGAELIYAPPAPYSAQNPAFSPDGQTLLFTAFHSGYNAGQAGIYRLSIDEDRQPVALLDEADQNSVNLPGACWNSNVNLIAFSSDREETDEIWVMAPDGSSRSRVTRHASASWYVEPSFAADGRTIVFEESIPGSGGENTGRLMKVETDGTGITTLIASASAEYDDRQPNWSPAGNRIVFQRRCLGTSDWNIYVVNSDGAGLAQLTDGAAADTDISWSPDGRWLVYSSDYGGLTHPGIFIVAATGGAPVRVSCSATNEDGAPSWSADGRWISFESHVGADENSRTALWRIAVPPELTNGAAALGADFDGDRLADPAVVQSGLLQVWMSGTGYGLVGPLGIGTAAGRLLAADFDDDGRADPARVCNGNWTAWISAAGYAPAGLTAIGFTRDTPLAGDFDGDSRADPASFNDGAWTFWLSSGGYQQSGTAVFGSTGCVPLAADFDGDGRADPTLVSDGCWLLLLSDNGYQMTGPVSLGYPSGTPVAADFDGDGKADPAVYADGAWISWLSAMGYTKVGPVRL